MPNLLATTGAAGSTMGNVNVAPPIPNPERASAMSNDGAEIGWSDPILNPQRTSMEKGKIIKFLVVTLSAILQFYFQANNTHALFIKFMSVVLLIYGGTWAAEIYFQAHFPAHFPAVSKLSIILASHVIVLIMWIIEPVMGLIVLAIWILVSAITIYISRRQFRDLLNFGFHRIKEIANRNKGASQMIGRAFGNSVNWLKAAWMRYAHSCIDEGQSAVDQQV